MERLDSGEFGSCAVLRMCYLIVVVYSTSCNCFVGPSVSHSPTAGKTSPKERLSLATVAFS